MPSNNFMQYGCLQEHSASHTKKFSYIILVCSTETCIGPMLIIFFEDTDRAGILESTLISVCLFKNVKSHIKLWGEEEQGEKYCLFRQFKGFERSRMCSLTGLQKLIRKLATVLSA